MARRLRGREARPARIGQGAERDQAEAVTDLADLAVDLEAALQLGAIVFAERPGERPLVGRRRRRAVVLRLRRSGKGGERDGESEDGARNGHGGFPRASFHYALTPDALTPDGGSTESAIEFGSGLVFSTRPSTGRMIRK